MSRMQSVEIAKGQVATVRDIIPVGVEHYVLRSGDRTYINYRTSDDALIRRIAENFPSNV